MHLLIIEAPTTGSGLHVLAAATRLGHEVTFATADVSRYRAEPPSGALAGVRVLHCDTSRAGAVVAAVRAGEGRFPGGRSADGCSADGCSPDGLVCLTDAAVEVAASVAVAFQVPFASPRAVATARNKDAFRRLCAETGLPAPISGTATSETDALRIAETLGYPCVIKPTLDGGSRGVALVSDVEQLRKAYAAILATSTIPLVLLEEYLRGPLVSLEVLVVEGSATLLGVSDRTLTRPPQFVELGEGFPVPLTAGTESVLTNLASEIAEALGFGCGPMHIEVVLTASGPKIVEVNPRLAGGSYGPMMCAALPYDVYEAIIDVALGRKPALAGSPVAAASGLGIYPATPGTLLRFDGLDLARSFPGVADVILRAAPGTWVTPPPNQGGEPGYLWATGESLPIAAARARAAAGVIEVVVE
ncbi:MAG: ATP-grasp domain-containing protein [Micromonosporaceae bacterium]|nr:ATP-grasp domain-containing protein [Micromonosporaceae bacterium]